MTFEEKLFAAKDFHDNRQFPEALDLINDCLDEDPENPAAINLFAVIMISTGRIGLAYNMAARALAKAPHVPDIWVNYGKVQPDNEEGWKDAEECFNRALEMKPDFTLAMNNMASLKVQQCLPEEGLEWCEKTLAIDPKSEQALSIAGFAHLMLQHWEEGFKLYDYTMGQPSRPDIIYNDLPTYKGEEGEVIMVNGEQGIGDELIFSSFLRDIAKKNKVVYDCMPRLKNLMTRSFADEPNIYVSGSRWSEEQVVPKDFHPTKCASAGSLGQYIRKTDEDFKGKAKLIADPEQRAAMRGLLDSISDKPKIGVAWTGGTKQSRMKFRQYDLERFLPFLRNPDVDYISLQYKNCDEEISEFEKKRGIKIHHFPWITEIKDYDPTAALVSELDLIISIPTSATQLAGALGKEVWVLVPEITGWLFYPNNYVWAESVKLFHKWTPKTVEKALKMWLEPVRKIANV